MSAKWWHKFKTMHVWDSNFWDFSEKNTSLQITAPISQYQTLKISRFAQEWLWPLPLFRMCCHVIGSWLPMRTGICCLHLQGRLIPISWGSSSTNCVSTSVRKLAFGLDEGCKPSETTTVELWPTLPPKNVSPWNRICAQITQQQLEAKGELTCKIKKDLIPKVIRCTFQCIMNMWLVPQIVTSTEGLV